MKYLFLILAGTLFSAHVEAQELQRFEFIGDADSKWQLFSYEVDSLGEIQLIEENGGQVIEGKCFFCEAMVTGVFLVVEYQEACDFSADNRITLVGVSKAKRGVKRVELKERGEDYHSVFVKDFRIKKLRPQELES